MVFGRGSLAVGAEGGLAHICSFYGLKPVLRYEEVTREKKITSLPTKLRYMPKE